MTERDVRVFPDAVSAAIAAAGEFVSACAGTAIEGRLFVAAISGGSTPVALFRLLATKEYREQLDWGRIHLFWVDERCVPPTHKDSNFGAAYDTLLSRVPVPPGNVHRIMGELGPDEAAMRYEGELRRHFGAEAIPCFDLVMLGMGADGHTASLFPGSPVLTEQTRLAVPVSAEGLASHRVTLTLPVINHAYNVVFLVTGMDKAGVMREVLEGGEGAGRYPASHVRPENGRLVWFIDNEAASGFS